MFAFYTDTVDRLNRADWLLGRRGILRWRTRRENGHANEVS